MIWQEGRESYCSYVLAWWIASAALQERASRRFPGDPEKVESGGGGKTEARKIPAPGPERSSILFIAAVLPQRQLGNLGAAAK